MSTEKNTITTVKIDLSKEQRLEARALAKSKGMTLQGLIGQLIKRELQKAEATNGSRNS